MDEFEPIEAFGEQVAVLEESLTGAQTVAESFSGELQQIGRTMSETGRGARSLSKDISRGLEGAIDGLVFDGMRISDALRQITGSVLSSAYSSAVDPVTEQLGSAAGTGLSALLGRIAPFATGGAFAQGRVMPFADGGVVSGPTTFPMRGGMGLMGEAGPEAIMPLTRGEDGRLGVRADRNERPVTVVMNVSTPDVSGFQRSQSQIAAQMGRAMSRGQRNR
jgi:phage-related minor tail protein